MQDSSHHKPQKLNLDKSKKYLSEDEMFYALNHDILNPKSLGKSTPYPANEQLCGIDQPAGENYSNGSHYAKVTNEAYSWHINSNGANYIMRVDGYGKCEIVYDNDAHGCLKLSPDPRHSIEDFRVLLNLEKICHNRDGKYLIWTNGLNDIGYLDVEASIATDSFTTPFFQKCLEDPCDFIRLCVPKPCGSIKAQYIPLPDDEISRTNYIVDAGFKFMYQFEYYDGRKSDWSDQSTFYFQDSKGCFDTAQGFPRCMKLRVPVGNPMVDKIHIAYNKGSIDEAGNDVWHRAEIVDKYSKYGSAKEKWYDRKLSEAVIGSGYSDDDCSFDYKFCNDKQCETIDPKEVSRVYNPIPREAQCLVHIKNGIGVFNYKTGTCPIDTNEIKKINIGLDCSKKEKECHQKYTKVKIRAFIHNYGHDRNQFIYREGDGSVDDPSDVAKFGGINPSLNGGVEDPIGYDQYFKDKVRNFIVYIDGTEYWAEMKQYYAEAFFNNTSFKGVIGGIKKGSAALKENRKNIRKGGFFYQECTLTVPTGTRGFARMASHHATGNEQHTSTFVIGVYKDIRGYKGNDLHTQNMEDGRYEIYIDTCDKETVDISEAFVIQDNAVDDSALHFGTIGLIADPKPASAYNGYIKDESGSPVTGLNLSFIAPQLNIDIPIPSVSTDHNGFYHFYENHGINGDIKVGLLGELDCGKFRIIKKETIFSESRTNTQANFTISELDNKDYQTNSLAHVKLKVVDCDGRGIGGIRVSLSGNRWRDTDPYGVATFVIRNISTRARNLRAIVIDHNGCFNIGCDDSCNPCMPTVRGTSPVCFYVKPPTPPSAPPPVPEINLGIVVLNKNSAINNIKGLKKGGVYPFGVVVKGRCGRISAVYELPSIEVPRLQKNNKVSYCGINYKSTQKVILPDWAACVDIVRGENINPFELQWLVDKKERTDDGKIKLTIQSLNDYNESYFFKTNTTYQWLKGDRVEFIKNGNGKTLLSSDHGLLNYLTLSPFFDKLQTADPKKTQTADFFNQLLIDDDGRLEDLEAGALIEIQRAKECVTQPVYFGIAVSIPVVQIDNIDGTTHGELLYPDGIFETFDTYLVKRKVGKFPAQSFEHHAPSDFWGDRLDDRGRAYFVNKYENEKRLGRSISISSPTQLNYFGDFVKHFEAPEMGDIIAVKITDGKILSAICEYDNFLAQVSDEFVRVGSDGRVTAASVDSIVSDLQPHLQGVYGCQYPDIGSIFLGDGFGTWVDSKRATYVHHENYQTSVDGSAGKVQSYFKQRCYEIISHNKKETNFYNHLRFSTGINKYTGAVHITIKRLRDSAIMNQPAPYLQTNETLVYLPDSKDWLTFHSHTPESYTQLHLHEDTGCAMVTYFGGVPYLSPSTAKANTWNEFCGVPCDRYVGISINKSPEKEKNAFALEIESEAMWYVKKVETDKPDYDSEIPPIRIIKTGRKWNAAFLGNKNSREGLFGGEQPRGYFIAVTFCRDNTDNLRYNTTDRNLRIKYDELDYILSKFMLVEASGFTGNL